MSPTYKVHRRINAPVEFNGFKGQYILFAGGSIIACLFLFAILYITGLNSWICLALCTVFGTAGIGIAWHYSHHYGVHGWRKRRLAGKTPRSLRTSTMPLFQKTKKLKTCPATT